MVFTVFCDQSGLKTVILEQKRKLGPGQLFLEWTDAVRVHGRKAGMGTMVTTAGAMPKSPFGSFWWVVLWDGSLGFTSTDSRLFLCTNYGSPAGARRPKACASTQMVRSSHPDDNWAYVWIPYVVARSTSILWKIRKIDSDIDSAS